MSFIPDHATIGAILLLSLSLSAMLFVLCLTVLGIRGIVRMKMDLVYLTARVDYVEDYLMHDDDFEPTDPDKDDMPVPVKKDKLQANGAIVLDFNRKQ
jgi:hypothetical protein